MYKVRQSETEISLEGPELCRKYVETGKITFGSSMLHPGHTGGIDPGHADSHEAFYVCSGHVVMRNPATNECFEMNSGDLVLVEEGEPHELTNIGDEIATIVWCAGPSPE